MTGPESPQSDRPSSVSTTEQGGWQPTAEALKLDLNETLKAVLHFWGPEGAQKVTRHVLLARQAHPAASAEAGRGKGEKVPTVTLSPGWLAKDVARAAARVEEWESKSSIPQVTEEEIAKQILGAWIADGRFATWGPPAFWAEVAANAVLNLLSSKASTTGKGGEEPTGEQVDAAHRAVAKHYPSCNPDECVARHGDATRCACRQHAYDALVAAFRAGRWW